MSGYVYDAEKIKKQTKKEPSEWDVYDIKTLEKVIRRDHFIGTGNGSIGTVIDSQRWTGEHDGAFEKACRKFTKRGLLAYPKRCHIYVSARSGLLENPQEDYVYDVYELRNLKRHSDEFYRDSSFGNDIGMVGARSNDEAYEKACRAFSRYNPEILFVRLRCEQDHGIRVHPLTTRELKEWQEYLLS